MLKKIVYLFIAMTLLLILGSCNANKNIATNNVNEVSSANDAQSTNGSGTLQGKNGLEKTPNTADLTTNEPVETFYGQWIIKKFIAFGPVGTYSNDDIKNILSRNLSFSKEKASCFGDEMKYLDTVAINPVYKKTTISKSDFAASYRNQLTFDSLGIISNYITRIDASDSNRNGCTFFIKDNDTLILYGGGAFFELDRVK